MDKNKVIAAIVVVLLGIGGALLKFDLKGAVCGSQDQPAQAQSQN